MKTYYNVHTIWLVMMLLTISTYVMGELAFSGVAAVLVLLATAAIKGIFIIRDFMELKGVSLLWCVIMYGWLAIVCVAIAVSYIISI